MRGCECGALVSLAFLFFKQKTAYEMRISDWSSDVCSSDLMARLIQGSVTKHNLMPRPRVVINRSGGAGAEGFLDVKASAGDPHKIIITLSNLFTTPMATGTPFSWKDLTPVAMLALEDRKSTRLNSSH